MVLFKRGYTLKLLIFVLLFLLSMVFGCDVTIENDDDSAVSVIAYYRDADGDGFGNPLKSVKALSQPDGYINNSNDCDDTDANINPDATETPGDSIDSNCNLSDDN